MPETLHALIAARLDGLSSDERRVVQNAAVLGKTFTKGALAAVAGEDPAIFDPVLAGLVRKEVLSIQADPRSPEHGQYGFLRISCATSPTRRSRGASAGPAPPGSRHPPRIDRGG